MGYKVFVSYKYSDSNVKTLYQGIYRTTVRDYVNIFENKIDISSNVYKGEHDGDDLSSFKDDTIWTKLKDKIYDSSITVIFISPNMKELGISEDEQWIPNEIAYSLKEMNRRTSTGCLRKSKSNALIAVVLPDQYGSYDYYIEENHGISKSRLLKTDRLFYILRENMFNQINPKLNKHIDGSISYSGESSYIESVKWDDFIKNMNYYFEKAIKRQENINEYNICKITTKQNNGY